MVAHPKVTAAFRRLVALVARCFYAGECPPKTEEEVAAPVTAKSKQQVEQHDTVLSLNLNKPISPETLLVTYREPHMAWASSY